jgi:Uma2 family endonuclease
VLARSPDTVRGPDVAFVSRERCDPVGAVPTAFPGPPDLAVEVLSRSDRPGDVIPGFAVRVEELARI